ncbi:MAG: hypothetical protein AAF644_11715, partial [Pseudomonadota bacterium]
MSIRKRLTLLILSMVILTCFLAFTKGYRESMNQAEALLDNELVTLAHVLIEQPLSKETPAYTSDLPQLLFQVWVDDSLASSSKSLQQNLSNQSQWQTGFSVENLAGQRVKVYRLSEGNKRVLIAEPLSKRVALTETVILSAMTPLLWSVPILA